MTAVPLDAQEIHGFRSPGELQRLEEWLDQAVHGGRLREVAVAEPYSGSSLFDERWFETDDGDRWRLVHPDSPFQGIFARIT